MFKFNFYSISAISFNVSTFNQKKMTTQGGCEFKSSLTISPTNPQVGDHEGSNDFRLKVSNLTP
jgi:hypothetical protein